MNRNHSPQHNKKLHCIIIGNTLYTLLWVSCAAAVQLTEREAAQLSTPTLLALGEAANGRAAPSPCRPLGAIPLGMGTPTAEAGVPKPAALASQWLLR